MNRVMLLPIATLLLALPGAAATDLGQADDVDIVCSDDPAGWTVCFAYNAISIFCVGTTFVDVTQCVLDHEVDNAQDYTTKMCTFLFQPWVCNQPPVNSPDQEQPVDCVNNPVGWTACYVAGIGLVVAYGCPSMQMDADWAQCVANKEVDMTQWYVHAMCDYVFQPWVCQSRII